MRRSLATAIAIAAATLATAAIVAGCVIAPPQPDRSEGVFQLASRDPSVVARGYYLVRGPAHCAACHGDPARPADGDRPLSGGRRFDLGIAGRFVARNLSSDPEAGIGAWSDAELVHALRDRRARDGRPLVPLMEFDRLTDADLRAVISYLRTLPPDPRPAAPSRPSWIGRLALQTVLRPGAAATPPATRAPAPQDAGYGRYLADDVANCDGCHTRRSPSTGAYVGPPYGGGTELHEDGRTFVAPGLAAPGVLQRLSEDDFVSLFRRRGARDNSSPMPWGAYARMTEVDLRAIYQYLRGIGSNAPPTHAPGLRATMCHDEVSGAA